MTDRQVNKAFAFVTCLGWVAGCLVGGLLGHVFTRQKTDERPKTTVAVPAVQPLGLPGSPGFDPEWVIPGRPEGVEPWVIYNEQYKIHTDRDALSDWFLERARCTAGYGGSEPNKLYIRLASDADATPRKRLLELAEEARKNLPEGCPIVIEVETLEEAIQDEERYLQRQKDAVERMKQIHGGS